MKGNCYNPYAARGIAVSCILNCQRWDYSTQNNFVNVLIDTNYITHTVILVYCMPSIWYSSSKWAGV